MRIVLLGLVLLCCSFAPMAQKKPMSLKQCIALAQANSIPLKQAEKATEAATANLDQSKMNRLPNVNGLFNYSFNQGRSVDPLTNSYVNQQLNASNVGVGVSALLFNGMRLQNIIQQNNIIRDAVKAEAEQAKNELSLNVILAYLQVLYNEDVLAIAKNQVAVMRGQAERMQVLVKEGAAANYQLAELQAQIASDEVAIIDAENQLQQAKLRLCALLNIDYRSDLELERTETAFPAAKYATAPAEIYQEALQRFSLVKTKDLRIKIAEKQLKITKSENTPVISLNAGIGSVYSSLAQTRTPAGTSQVATGDYVLINGNPSPVFKQQQNYSDSRTGYFRQLNNNLGTFLGLTVQVPVFNSNRVNTKMKLARLDLETARLDADNARVQLKQNIEMAYLNLSTAFDKYKLLAGQTGNFEESFRAAEVRFNLGVIHAAEFLITRNNLNNFRINLARAKYEYGFRVEILEFYRGIEK